MGKYNKLGNILEKIYIQSDMCLIEPKSGTCFHQQTGITSIIIDIAFVMPKIYSDIDWTKENDLHKK